MERPIIKVDRRYCPHCHSNLSIKTFKTHRRLYYDEERSRWNEQDSDDNEDMDLSAPPRIVSRADLRSCELNSVDNSPPRFGKHNVKADLS